LSDNSPSRDRDHSIVGLLLAGGMGTRIRNVPKAFFSSHDQTLLERVTTQLEPHVDRVLVGLPADWIEKGAALVGDRAAICEGGSTRQGTMENLLAQSDSEFVLLHDVARPLVSSDLYRRVIAAGFEHGAAISSLRITVRDSMALGVGEYLGEPLDRERVVFLQTPGVFSRKLLEGALATARSSGWTETGVATLVARAGGLVKLVAGEESNFKITYPEDWERIRGDLG
jgi:2-C-methyl-D-erythritol 4-phosphate cytidylyltransferase